MSNATPVKLNDGTWGARVKGITKVGEKLKITTRAGKSWEAEVVKIIWTGSGITLVATCKANAQPTSNSNCNRCCPTATRTAQIWEDCPYCGAEPIYV